MNAECHSCNGRCCRSLNVGITVFDAWRISRHLDLAWTAFLQHDEFDADVQFFGIGVAGSDRPFRMVLEKSVRDSDACTFLATMGAIGRCGIYNVRPLVCSVYPFAAIAGTPSLRDQRLCKPDDWNLSLLDFNAMRQELARYYAEAEANRIVVDRWNAGRKRNRTFANFCTYASGVVDRFLDGRDLAEDQQTLGWYSDPTRSDATAERLDAWFAALHATLEETAL